MNRRGGMYTILLVAFTSLVACGDVEGPEHGIDEQTSRATVPENPELAKIYNRSCRNCHTVAATRAPLTGDTAAWSALMDKGMDVLVANVVNGIGGMPPFGLCMSCDADDFEALIRFMAADHSQP